LPNLNQENDILQSIEYIKQFTNNNLVFSYPNGLYNNETLDIMKKYNCKFGFTTKIDNITKDTDLLQIPRYDAPQTLPL
jgi:peptidoglycan/xylan/chitin deacetylase (PgdA/CDA1 family)